MQIGVEGFRFKLGEIKWHAHWRRYALFPGFGTVFEQDCLRTIADHCQRKTQDHRKAAGSNLRDRLKIELGLPMVLG